MARPRGKSCRPLTFQGQVAPRARGPVVSGAAVPRANPPARECGVKYQVNREERRTPEGTRALERRGSRHDPCKTEPQARPDPLTLCDPVPGACGRRLLELPLRRGGARGRRLRADGRRGYDARERRADRRYQREQRPLRVADVGRHRAAGHRRRRRPGDGRGDGPHGEVRQRRHELRGRGQRHVRRRYGDHLPRAAHQRGADWQLPRVRAGGVRQERHVDRDARGARRRGRRRAGRLGLGAHAGRDGAHGRADLVRHAERRVRRPRGGHGLLRRLRTP